MVFFSEQTLIQGEVNLDVRNDEDYNNWVESYPFAHLHRGHPANSRAEYQDWYYRVYGIEAPRPPPPTWRNRFPATSVTEDQAGQVCSICLDVLSTTPDSIVTLSCNHAFHADCIYTWLNDHPNCPVCRQAISSNNHANDYDYYGGYYDDFYYDGYY